MGKPDDSLSPKKERTIGLYVLSFLGFTFSLLAFWPGFMEFDSLEQYAQVRGIVPLDNWYPISMAILWRFLLPIHDGPEPLLILQLGLYWGGFLYLALRSYRRTSNFLLAIVAVLVPFAPFLLNFVGVIWKDVHLALCFFWSCLLLCFDKPSRAKLVISLVFIYYGISVRYNGLFAALPLVVLWSDRFSAFTGIRNKFRLPLLTFSVILFYWLLSSTLAAFIPFDKYSPLNAQLLNEITYIQCHSTRDDFSFPVNYYGERWQKLKSKYRKKQICDRVISLASSADTNIIFDEEYLQHPDYKDPDIKRLWFRTVITHPLQYIQYRFIVYRTFLRPFKYEQTYYYIYDALHHQDNDADYFRPSMQVVNPLGITNYLIHYITLSSRIVSIFFRPLFWLIALFSLVGFSVYMTNKFVFLVSLSGLLYLLMYFFFLPSPDFRYAYYSILAATVGIFLSFKDLH
ncbi:MAG: hypothetical protein N5P05_000970 [Chroococcopsis gigantea SAG 12.99]|jgi:hypothetical protein|nr:hypothetical protein [Chlorogloea purpurea SAG 13.99]MDV2999364.1 hypothetical protein [Chroococcopsis gigantea SAG 12.99]